MQYIPKDMDYDKESQWTNLLDIPHVLGEPKCQLCLFEFLQFLELFRELWEYVIGHAPVRKT